MDFESPDVERDFPGLYASESGKRSDDSDLSDDGEKISKKDLLSSKKKEKKDKGYATLEGESSPDTESHLKSPSRSKKSKAFKFTTKKEKRDKSIKDVKESSSRDSKETTSRDRSESEGKVKKKSEDKKKDKETKTKIKLKDKKKSKQDDTFEIEDMPVFGVPLSVATERSKCHDGVDLPLIVRHCIDHVQQTGLAAENVYKVSGIKSKVEQVKKLYNQRESVSLYDYDLPTATSLLKQFLRELPEPVFTTELVEKFEEAGSIQDVRTRGEKLKALVDMLPSCNKTLLTWLIKHFDNVSVHEKQNKMNAQSIAVTLSPVLQSSQRLISALLCHASHIFPNITLDKYIPPVVSADCLSLSDDIDCIEKELRKQESLLEMLHSEINRGLITKSREEQLWEVQRIVTQLKRRLKTLEKVSGSVSLPPKLSTTDDIDSSNKIVDNEIAAKVETVQSQVHISADARQEPEIQALHPEIKIRKEIEKEAEVIHNQVKSISPVKESSILTSVKKPIPDKIWRNEPTSLPTNINQFKPSESLEVEEINKASILVVEKKQLAILETEELTNVIINLRALCQLESKEIKRIKNKIIQLSGNPDVILSTLSYISDEDEVDEPQSLPVNFESNSVLAARKRELSAESNRLRLERDELLKRISNECESCISLRVQIRLLQMSSNSNQVFT